MKNLIHVGRVFFGAGITGLGIQQFQYADFRPVILPPWPAWLHTSPVWAYIAGAALIAAGIMIVIGKKTNKIALLLGIFFLFFFVVFHVPYLLFINPNSPRHLGLWTDPLKELALSGGAFIIAGAIPSQHLATVNKTYPAPVIEKLIPVGSLFFSIMLILFGIDHFLYPDFVVTIVPAWIPGATFWTYFAAVALIGSGIAILFKIRLKQLALLTGIMIFLWVILLHIPRAIADPSGNKGNEITSVFEALAFSGIAFVIACMHDRKTS